MRETAGGTECPTCGQRGKRVETSTVRALLSVSLMEVQAVEYFFCRTESCPTVYFAGASDQVFTEAHLRQRVHQKHPGEDDVFVCYCFRHTPGTIKQDLVQMGHTEVVEAITAGIEAGKCACDIRNPQGSCCLGNVRGVVQRLAASARVEA